MRHHVEQDLIALYGNPMSVGHARRWIKTFLGDAHPLLGPVLATVSELVSNAIQHSRSRNGWITLGIKESPIEVLIEVLDEGSDEIPTVKIVEPDALGGRGLFIVSQTADSWGSAPGELVGLVWAAFLRSGL